MAPIVAELFMAGLPIKQADALRAISYGLAAWREAQVAVEEARASLGDTQAWADLFDERVYAVYVQWRRAEDDLHAAGGISL